MQDSLVSIITPAYNAEKYIAETIESVIVQTYQDWEMLIVNDGSKDNTEKIVQSYIAKDKRIKLINLKQNIGVAEARNEAIKSSKGRYLAFLDSDDIWTHDKLTKQISFMKENGYCFTYHNYISFDTTMSKECGTIIKVPHCVDYNELLKSNSTGSCLTTIIDRRFIKEVYMPKQKHEDYICWLNILKKYNIKAYGMNDILGYYRVGKISASSNKLKSAYWTWMVYWNSQNIGLLRSIYYFINYAVKGIMKFKF